MRKYGRTYHLPLSPGGTSDDKVMVDIAGLMVDDLVVTEKMDGENSTIHSGGTHARSPDSRHHPSRDWLRAFAAGISPNLAARERIVGENMYARHAISYDQLPSYFLGFAWIIDGTVQSWDRTLDRFEELGISPVHTLYRGPYKLGLFEGLASSLMPSLQEGFVARVAAAFPEEEQPVRMGKYVRAGHVDSEEHWMQQEVVPNRLTRRP